LRQSFDLGAAIVNTRTLAGPAHIPCGAAGTLRRTDRFPFDSERQEPMTSTTIRTPEQSDKQAKSERDKSEQKSKRAAREKALDQALADTFPASDPVAASEPAPAKD
jgi:hypothetical protein